MPTGEFEGLGVISRAINVDGGAWITGISVSGTDAIKIDIKRILTYTRK